MRLKYESVCRFVSERSIPQRADEFQSLLAQVTVRPVNPTRFRKFRTLFVDASRDRVGRFAQPVSYTHLVAVQIRKLESADRRIE